MAKSLPLWLRITRNLIVISRAEFLPSHFDSSTWIRVTLHADTKWWNETITVEQSCPELSPLSPLANSNQHVTFRFDAAVCFSLFTDLEFSFDFIKKDEDMLKRVSNKLVNCR